MQDAQRGADIEFTNVEVGADALIGERPAAAAIDYALDVACAALCAEAVGAMAELHKITVEYLKTRSRARDWHEPGAAASRGGHADARRNVALDGNGSSGSL